MHVGRGDSTMDSCTRIGGFSASCIHSVLYCSKLLHSTEKAVGLGLETELGC